ncbi:MAG: sigma-70 family RNA polymerase sigma factor, partial [Chloroflexia bacterium]|nr:sigma-70 family RNA polymerase sigma factor [Chloroflexia bacterium]
MTLLFCGLCLGYGLLPVVVLSEGHAFALVSLRHGPERCTAFDRGEQHQFVEGLLTDVGVLRALVAERAYLAIECTGFAQSDRLSPDLPEGAERNAGLLDFDAAVRAGAAQLEQSDRPLRAALDEAMTILSKSQHEVLTMHYYFGLSLDKIADIRQCSRQNVYQQHDVALERIHYSKYREVLAEFLP